MVGKAFHRNCAFAARSLAQHEGPLLGDADDFIGLSIGFCTGACGGLGAGARLA